MAEDDFLNFNTDLIKLNNQNLEEEEELEDLERRKAEIHDLLVNALDDFNFDDESTMNSPTTSFVEAASNNNSVNKSKGEKEMDNINTEYNEADMNEQLKVLYDVRTREVHALNKKLEELTAEVNQQQIKVKNQITLLEIENERKNISLKETNELLIDKAEEIRRLEGELKESQHVISNLEKNIKELREEKAVLHQSNLSLEQQIALMDRGFPLLQNKADKEAIELQRNKIFQLEHSLTKALEQTELKNGKIRELKQTIEGNHNNLRENEFYVRELTEKLDHANKQIQEFHSIVDELRKQNAKQTESNLSEELQRIRLQNETNDNLCDTVRKVITEEFHDKLAFLDSENKTLKNTMFAQESQFEKTKEELKTLQEEYNRIRNELGTVKDERDILQNKLAISQIVTEQSAQTSFYTNNDHSKAEALAVALTNINKLENQLQQMQQENAQLQVKVGLERERESLIRKLQEKAIEFEKLIYEKQKPILTSVAVNTENDHSDNNSLLKVKYDALLYQTEVKLRKELKKEFDSKLEKLYKDCNTCDDLKEQMKQLNDAREQDRLAVINLVKTWEEKFLETEKENQDRVIKLTSLKDFYDTKVSLFMAKLQEEYQITSKKYDTQLKQTKYKCESHKNKLIYEVSKIKTSIQEGDDEVKMVEKRFLKEKAALEKRISSLSNR